MAKTIGSRAYENMDDKHSFASKGLVNQNSTRSYGAGSGDGEEEKKKLDTGMEELNASDKKYLSQPAQLSSGIHTTKDFANKQKAAELTYTTRKNEWLKNNPQGTSKQFNLTNEGGELSKAIQDIAGEAQGY